MSITKVGSEFIKEAAPNLPQYVWGGVKKLWNFAKWFPNSGIKKPGKPIAKGFTKAILNPVVKGVAGAGKFLYNKPHIAIPAAAFTYLGAKGVADNIHKNMYHVDPKYDITRSNLFGQIKYRVPEYQDKYKDLSLFNV